MNFAIRQLIVNCKKERDILPFTQFNYRSTRSRVGEFEVFWGLRSELN